MADRPRHSHGEDARNAPGKRSGCSRKLPRIKEEPIVTQRLIRPSSDGVIR
jgi:hypothetical protein